VPSSTTVGARIACLSSFYRFTIRMGLLTGNPCDALERPRTVPSVARGYSADEVRRLLAVVPDTVRGRRDRAILLVLVLTGRRRAEVIGLRAGDLSLEGDTVFYTYRGKGGKRGRREIPRPAYEAIVQTLADAGLELATMDPAESLWQAGAGPGGITSGTFYGRFRRYLEAAGLTPTGLHVLRHTAAKLRRDADGIANIAPTVRFVKGIRLEDGSLRAELEAALEVDDSWDGFAWQCQSCGTAGHTIEDVVEEA